MRYEHGGVGRTGIRILRALYDARGRVVGYDRLIEAVYHDRTDGGPETAHALLKVYICRLRKVLGRDSITCTHRVGYRLQPKAMPDALDLLPVEKGE